MRRLALTWAWLLAWMAASDPAAALPTPRDLTLDEALTRALRDSPVVKNAQADYGRALAEARTSWSWALRGIGANIGVVPPIGSGSWAANAGITVTVNLGEWLVGGPSMMKNSEAQVNVARNNLERSRLEVAAQVTAAYAAYVASRRILALRKEAEAAARQDEAVIKREFTAGNATGADLRRARVTWSQAAAELALAESEVNRTWAALLAVMGDGTWLDRQAGGGGQ